MGTEKLGTEIRQEQIVQAALGLIAQRGLKHLSVARLARRVGLVPSAIYRHYKSKDDIINAILDEIRSNLLANATRARQEFSDPLEILRRMLFLHIQFIRANQSLPSVLFSEDIYFGHPDRKQKVYAMLSAYLEQVAGVIEGGQKSGVIQSKALASVLAVMFLGLIQPGAILWQMSEGEFDVTRQAEKAWEVFQGALCGVSGA